MPSNSTVTREELATLEEIARSAIDSNWQPTMGRDMLRVIARVRALEADAWDTEAGLAEREAQLALIAADGIPCGCKTNEIGDVGRQCPAHLAESRFYAGERGTLRDTVATLERERDALKADGKRNAKLLDFAWTQFKALFKNHPWGAYVGAINEDADYKELCRRDAARTLTAAKGESGE